MTIVQLQGTVRVRQGKERISRSVQMRMVGPARLKNLSKVTIELRENDLENKGSHEISRENSRETKKSQENLESRGNRGLNSRNIENKDLNIEVITEEAI
jgi:hypothetical protein